MRKDPPSVWSDPVYVRGWQKAQYDEGLAGRVYRHSHRLGEKGLRGRKDLLSVVEVGAGQGEHIGHVLHPYNRYTLVDSSSEMLDRAKLKFSGGGGERLRFATASADALPFDDGAFDRLVAVHVLEHLYKPHEILREWDRVVRPGGVISLVLPCDPAPVYKLGSLLGAPRRWGKKCGYDFDYLIAREHVNPIHNLIALIRYYFAERTELWWPIPFCGPTFNLMTAINIVKTE